jgi:hypothetical protein
MPSQRVIGLLPEPARLRFDPDQQPLRPPVSARPRSDNLVVVARLIRGARGQGQNLELVARKEASPAHLGQGRGRFQVDLDVPQAGRYFVNLRAYIQNGSQRWFIGDAETVDEVFPGVGVFTAFMDIELVD